MRAAPMLLAISILNFDGSDANAQASVEPDAPAGPIIGQVSLARSSLSTMTGGNASHFSLVPSLQVVYDSDILRYANLNGAPRDNKRVTPGVDFSYRRLFGRTQLGVGGSVGYDYNSRFSYLNQTRIQANASAKTPVGAVCSSTVDASYEQRQFDFENTQTTGGSTLRDQVYDLTANCQGLEGFSPTGGLTYRSLDSSGSNYYGYTQLIEQIGVQYYKPSIGAITLSGSAAQLRRPNLAQLTGFSDNTNLRSVSIGIDRAVSPRFKINVAVGVTNAKPERAQVRSFFGASYDGQIQWLPSPRFSLTGTALRQVTNQNGISSTFVIEENFGLSAAWMLSAASQFRLDGLRQQRVFRGESLTPTLQPLRADRVNLIAATYNYRIARDLRLGFAVNRRWRYADNAFYNYKSTQVSASIGAQF